MLRSALLALSRRRAPARWLSRQRGARALVQRFVPGESLEEVTATARRLQQEGVGVVLNHLGEEVISVAAAAGAAGAYVSALEAMHQAGLDGYVSLKPSQVGLTLDVAAAREHVRMVLRAARAAGGCLVRIEAEHSSLRPATLSLVEELRGEGWTEIGAVVQAYLRTAEDDARRLIAADIPVRLVKGAYQETNVVAFARKSETDRSYAGLAGLLLREGRDPELATHDQGLLESILASAPERGRFSIAMLYGIRSDLLRRLAASWRVRSYLPYGPEWYPYIMRRLAERPANLGFVLRNLLRG